MAAETILVVDENATNLKSTRRLLADEGYKVLTAGGVEEAADLLRSFAPDLVLADLTRAVLNTEALAQQFKPDKKTRAMLLTADAGDGQRAMAAGWDGFIEKPLDGRTLATQIRALFDRPASGDGPSELQGLRDRFLTEGRGKARAMLLQLDASFNPSLNPPLNPGPFNQKDAARTVHQWKGTGGLLGYAAISRLAGDAESVLEEQPFDGSQLREVLSQLETAFSSPRKASEAPLPESIARALKGKRIAGVEFPVEQQQRLYEALERAGAYGTFLSAMQSRESFEARRSDLTVIHVNAETKASAWLDAEGGPPMPQPVVLAGKRDDLLGLPQSTQAMAREFLMDGWQAEEALVRLSLALGGRYQPEQLKPPPAAPARTSILIADDDPTVLALVRTTLENFGMECRQATDGSSALELIRQTLPQAAVLDVNMPGMDGYEVLAAVRREKLPVRILLLTARQQESDVVRGFTLGADDYVVKPFSPMELVARVKRLLAR